MSSQDPIIFYDLRSRPPCKTWSPNPWKTRFALNFKGVSYKTDWSEYPHLRAKLSKLCPARTSGPFEYTSPTVTFPDGETVMDSRVIADALEERYPEPSMNLQSSQLARLEKIMIDAVGKARPIIVPAVPRMLLSEVAQDHWYTTREKIFGMKMDEFEKTGGPCGEIAWREAEPVLREATVLLTETDGPFFMGYQVSYADFVWGGFMIFLQKLGLLDAMLERAGEREAHLQMLEGISKYAKRDDH